MTPAGSRSEKKTARILALPIPATGDGQAPVALELPGVPLKSVHGYRLDPKGTRFAVSINGTVPRILVYPVDTSRVTGKPVEIRLD